MEAGWEIDVLVAERVMGLKYFPEIERNLRPYSTNISDAWDVWEKLVAMPIGNDTVWSLTKNLDSYSVSQVTWGELYERDAWHTFGEASTPSLAICLAALKAVGLDTEVAVKLI